MRKLDVLQELIEDESVTEIMVNGPDNIFVERAGKLTRWNKTFTSKEKLEDVIQQIVGRCNRVVNESMPIVDARLENGARVNVVVYPAHFVNTGMAAVIDFGCLRKFFDRKFFIFFRGHSNVSLILICC